MIDLQELLKKPEYKFIEDYKDRLCFIALSGSYAYGTNNEDSDIDIRGVVLPTKDELIGLNSFEQRIDNDTDTVLYEFNKFVHLAANTNPNIIELLGSPQYIIFNEVGQKLIDNAKMFLSKKCINSFGGYANQQLRRVENALSHNGVDEKTLNKHIFEVLKVAQAKLAEIDPYVSTDYVTFDLVDGELYMTVNFDAVPIHRVTTAFNELLTIKNEFNKLNHRNDKLTEKKLNKHLMHLVRLYKTCFDILEKGEINTYRKDDVDFLMSIRNGRYLVDHKLTDEFTTCLDELNERFQKDKELNVVPNKCDFNEINNFVIEVNSKVIKDEIKTYTQPIVVSKKEM